MIAKPDKLAVKILSLDKDKLYELKEYKYPRNLKQNKKYWKFLYELSLKLRIGVEELHFQMLKDYSARYQLSVPHNTEIRGIEYYKKVSTRKRENGSLWDIYYVYATSHELNEKEFSILLNGLIQECQQQNIETRSPDEIIKDETLYEI